MDNQELPKNEPPQPPQRPSGVRSVQTEDAPAKDETYRNPFDVQIASGDKGKQW